MKGERSGRASGHTAFGCLCTDRVAEFSTERDMDNRPEAAAHKAETRDVTGCLDDRHAPAAQYALARLVYSDRVRLVPSRCPVFTGKGALLGFIPGCVVPQRTIVPGQAAALEAAFRLPAGFCLRERAVGRLE